MSLDEQFLEMTDKIIIIEQVNGNVIPSYYQKQFKKDSFYCPFFSYPLHGG